MLFSTRIWCNFTGIVSEPLDMTTSKHFHLFFFKRSFADCSYRCGIFRLTFDIPDMEYFRHYYKKKTDCSVTLVLFRVFSLFLFWPLGSFYIFEILTLFKYSCHKMRKLKKYIKKLFLSIPPLLSLAFATLFLSRSFLCSLASIPKIKH